MARPKVGEPIKSDFIRNHPNVPAAQVVAKAAAAGIKIAPSFVYQIRSRETARKKAGRPRTGKSETASDFVRKMPRDVPAKDVIAAAARKGIKLSANLVYIVRSKARAGGAAPVARGRRGRKRRGQLGGADVVAFKKLALGIGLERARQELDEFERGVAQLIGS